MFLLLIYGAVDGLQWWHGREQGTTGPRPFGPFTRPFGSGVDPFCSNADPVQAADPSRLSYADRRCAPVAGRYRRATAGVGLTSFMASRIIGTMRQGVVNRASNATGLLNAMELLGVERKELLVGQAAAVGHALTAGAPYVTQDSLRHLADRAIRFRSKAALYEPLLKAMKMSEWGVLGLAAQSAPTVRHALELIIRRYDFWTNSGSWRLELRADTFALYWSRAAVSAGDCALNEVLQARTRGVLSYLVGRPVRILESGLGHEHLGERRKLNDLLEANVRYGQRGNYLILPREYLDQTPSFERAQFHAHLMRELEERAVGNRPRSFSEQVRDALEHGVALPGGLSRQAVARQLGVSEGTLKRRMRQELNTSYKTEYDRFVSREVHSQLVGTSRSIEQVADTFGYTSSGFTRACKAWFGASPSEVRRAHSHSKGFARSRR